MRMLALSLLTVLLAAQEAPVRPPMPPPRAFSEGPGDATRTDRPGLKPSSTALVVQGRPIQVPEPPKDALAARAGLEAALAQAKADETLLSAELKRLYAEQAAQIQDLRAHPEQAEEGQRSAEAKDLQARMEDTRMRACEQSLARETEKAVDALVARRERSDQVQAWSAQEDQRHPTTPFEQDNDQGETGVRRSIQAWDGTTFLQAYAPIWKAYHPRLEAYIQDTASTLGRLELGTQPAAVQVLDRAVQIQFFERVRALIRFNAAVWTLAGARVPEPKYYADVAHSVSMPDL